MKCHNADQEALRLAAAQKARQMWAEFTANERAGVRLGLFPYEKMMSAEKEGHDGKLLAVALMDCAKADGGMVM
jgi:hypothetical protein